MSGKVSGPDGFTLQYYKLLPSELLPHLSLAFNFIPDDLCFTKESLRAHINKEGKDPAQCAHYRPISLLNLDLKILRKIMAERLANFVSELVS